MTFHPSTPTQKLSDLIFPPLGSVPSFVLPICRAVDVRELATLNQPALITALFERGHHLHGTGQKAVSNRGWHESRHRERSQPRRCALEDVAEHHIAVAAALPPLALSARARWRPACRVALKRDRRSAHGDGARSRDHEGVAVDPSDHTALAFSCFFGSGFRKNIPTAKILAIFIFS